MKLKLQKLVPTGFDESGFMCADFQVDTNKDRLVSLSEFIAATKKEEFLEKNEWEVRARKVSFSAYIFVIS